MIADAQDILYGRSEAAAASTDPVSIHDIIADGNKKVHMPSSSNPNTRSSLCLSLLSSYLHLTSPTGYI